MYNGETQKEGEKQFSSVPHISPSHSSDLGKAKVKLLKSEFDFVTNSFMSKRQVIHCWNINKDPPESVGEFWESKTDLFNGNIISYCDL